MKKMFWMVVLALLLSPVFLFAQEQVEAPTFKNGDFWHFNVSDKMVTTSSLRLRGMYEVLFNDGKLPVFKIGQDEKSPVDGSRGQTLILYAMFGRGTYFGGKYLEFPLTAGKKWDIEFSQRPTGATKDVSFKGETTVAGFESVSTPAGNLRVLKLIREIRSSNRNSNNATYYYSPEAKSVVKMLFEFADGPQTIELVKFGAAQ